jgi:hypothetical protein
MSGFYWDNIAGPKGGMARWDRKAATGRMVSRGGITGWGVNIRVHVLAVGKMNVSLRIANLDEAGWQAEFGKKACETSNSSANVRIILRHSNSTLKYLFKIKNVQFKWRIKF